MKIEEHSPISINYIRLLFTSGIKQKQNNQSFEVHFACHSLVVFRKQVILGHDSYSSMKWLNGKEILLDFVWSKNYIIIRLASSTRKTMAVVNEHFTMSTVIKPTSIGPLS